MHDTRHVNMASGAFLKKQRKKEHGIDSSYSNSSAASTSSASPKKKRKLFLGRAKSVTEASPRSSIDSKRSDSSGDVDFVQELPLQNDHTPGRTSILLPRFPYSKSSTSQSKANASVSTPAMNMNPSIDQQFSTEVPTIRYFTSNIRSPSPENIYADIFQVSASDSERSHSDSPSPTLPQNALARYKKRSPDFTRGSSSAKPSPEQAFWQSHLKPSTPVIARQPSRRYSRTASQPTSVYHPISRLPRARITSANSSGPPSPRLIHAHRPRQLALTPRKGSLRRYEVHESGNDAVIKDKSAQEHIGLGIQLSLAERSGEVPSDRSSGSSRSAYESESSWFGSKRIPSGELEQIEETNEGDDTYDSTSHSWLQYSIC